MESKRRMYNDLNWTWPLISREENYVEAAESIIKAVMGNSGIDVKTALHIGCGGGGHDHTLKKSFELTGVDLSEEMLEHARKLNPDVTYYKGDMRSVRLGKRYDAVMIADSINYMLTEDDLGAAFKTAFEHLRPGGLFFTYAEYSVERFQQNMTWCSPHKKDDIDITLIQNNYDPDTSDTVFETTFVYLIRRNGRLEVETDVHCQGLFKQDVWMRLLRDAGFNVETLESRSGKYLGYLCTR